MNVICVAIVVLGTETWGMAMFDLATTPWNAMVNGTCHMGGKGGMGGM